MADRDEVVTQQLVTEPSPAATASGAALRAPAESLADPDAEVVAYRPSERYAERDALGVGGMGEVRLCRDRAIGREVAMKVMGQNHAADANLRARFVREARVQAQLEHPAIVPVYDFGLDAKGNAYFTMKRVRGVTLTLIIEGQRRGDATLLREYGRHRLLAAFVQVCRAIDYAHERGVLHRDLKPDNLMLGPYGEVYVLDWGLATVQSASRRLDARDPLAAPGEGPIELHADAEATAVGTVFGTPAYMAPEQIRGLGSDERTDVYMLGAILFELLTGEPLHGSGTAQERMDRARRGVDARPSQVAPGIDVSPELEAVCVHACAREPSARFASARELADAVEAYLSGDRDLELRRELAAVHLERAKDAAARAEVPGGSLDDRRVALAEAGRAVALAPDDRRAREMLLDVLTRPPREAPTEVMAQVERDVSASQRRMLLRVAFILSSPWLLILPACAVIGVRSWSMIALAMLPWVLCSVYLIVVHRLGRSTVAMQRLFSVVASTAVALSSLFYGVTIIMPTLAVALAFGAVLQQHRAMGRFSSGMFVLAVAIPSVLAFLGLHPVGYHALGDALVMHPGALALDQRTLLFSSCAVNLLVLLGGVRYGLKFRDATTELALANHLAAWHLKQLVPEETARAMSSMPPAV